VWGITEEYGKCRDPCGLILESKPIAGNAFVPMTSWLRNRSAHESKFLFPGSSVRESRLGKHAEAE
jgi:hypothetical protein